MWLAKEKPQSPCIMATQPVEIAHVDRVIQSELGAQRAATAGGTFGLVISSPNGSPGARASMVNRMRLMASRLGIASSRRRIM